MSDLSLNIRFKAFENLSRVAYRMQNSLGGVERRFSQTTNELSQLQRHLRDVNSMNRTREALARTGREAGKVREKMNQLRERMRDSGAQQSATEMARLQREFERASRSLARLESRQSSEERQLLEISERLREAGVNTRELSNEEDRLRRSSDRLNRSLARQEQHVNRLNRLRAHHAGAQQTQQRMAAASGTMAGVGGTALGSATVMGVGLAGMFTPGVEFEYQMSKVQALSGLTKQSKDMQALQRQALDLGSTTQYTATQVGEAQQFLLMAGFGAKNTYASMEGVLQLASASGTDIATAADIMSNIGGAFKVNMSNQKEVKRLVNALIATTANSNVSLEMLGETMPYLGQAEGVNMSVEQALAMSGTLGNIGIQGSMAGTTIRGLINRASAPTGAAAKVMKKYGLNFKTSGDDMKDFMDIIKQVERTTRNMGNAKRAEVIKAIFGVTAGSGITELMAAARNGELERLLGNITAGQQNDVGSQMAKTMMDNAMGDVLSLGSAWEGLSIIISQTNAGSLREFIQNVTKIVNKIRDWVKENPMITRDLVKLVAVITAASAALGVVLLVLAPFVLSLGMARLAVGYFYGGIMRLAWLVESALPLIAKLGQAFMMLGQFLLANPIWLAVAAGVVAIWWLWQNWETVTGFLQDRWAAWVNFLDTNSVASTIKGTLTDLIEWLMNLPTFFQELGQSVAQSLFNWDIQSPVGSIIMGIVAFFATLPAKLVFMLDEACLAMVDSIMGWDLLSPVKAVIDAVVGYVGAAMNKVKGFFSSVGEELYWFKQNLGFGGEDAAAGLAKGVQAGGGKAAQATRAVAGGMVSAYRDATETRSPSRVFARLGAFIPQGLATGILGAQATPMAAIRSVSQQLALGAGLALPAVTMANPLLTTDHASEGSGRANSIAGGASVSIVINIAGNASQEDAQRIAEAVRAELAKQNFEQQARERARLFD